MASYTLKELKEMSNEQLIVKLITIQIPNKLTKTQIQTEEKILKILSERNVINYDIMKKTMEISLL